jgi:hypothetical protein
MEGLLDFMKEVGQEINAEKTNYMFMFHHQNASKNYNVEGANKFYEKETVFTNDNSK